MSHPLWLIAKQEFTLNRRNRWLVSFAVLFSALTLLVSCLGMVTSGYSGFQDFVRTSASVINLGGFVVPLFALLLGVFSFLSHREHLELMVTQPISRSQALLGKYLGLLLTVVGATLLGFGLPGIVFSLVVGVEGAFGYALVVLFDVLLAVGGPHLFGPAGATLVKMTGSASMAGVLGLAALLLWILIPLLISIRLFSRQNL